METVQGEAPRTELSDASYQSLAESIPGALFLYTLTADGRERLRALGSRCQGIWELTPAQFERNPSLLWAMPDAAAAQSAREALRASARSLLPWQAEWQILTPSGARKWVQGSGQPERGADGATRWHLVMLDVSERKRAEQALRSSEARFRELVEGLEKVSVQGYDRERRVIVWNAASEALYGYTRAEAMGQRLEDLIIPPEMCEAVVAGTREWLDAGVVSIPSEELVLRRKDGQPVHVFSSHAMQFNEHGEAELYCVDIDLSERHALELRLREAHKLEAMGRLAGGIAHDFNNVLGGLLGNVALASGQLPGEHPAQPYLDLIMRGGQHARGLVQQILAFSRRQPQALQAVELQPLVEQTLALMRAATPPGIHLVLRTAAAALQVQADATQLQQVLMNLCTNAWHAMEGHSGSVLVGLGLRTRAGRSCAHLWVRDSGSGMDAHTRTHLFEPFFTTKPAGQGTGLGLAVVHGIVLAHQGEIEVESELGEGSCFHVYLPLLPRDPPAPVIPAVAGSVPAAPLGRHVLYLDDDEVMRLTARGLLERIGCRVSLFQRGAAAVEAVAAAPQDFDLVVTDFNMLDFSGLQVARELAMIRPDLPVVLSSGYVSEELQLQAQQAGVAAVLRKEMSFEELGPLVQQLLATHRH